MNLLGKVALITGGSRGIGQGIAQCLAKEGADIAFFYRTNSEAAKESEKKLSSYNRENQSYQIDVTNFDQVSNGINQVLLDFNRIDILVNNAGRAPGIHLLADVPLKEWHGVIDLDLTGVFYCCKLVIPIMRKQKYGQIINISSVVGSNCQEGSASYAASKAGVEAITKVLAKEEGRNGIRVNAIAPGFIQTQMSLKMIEAMGEEVFNDQLNKLPLPGMKGYPDDIGNAVAFLAGDKGRYLTGQVIHINGGSWMP